MTKPKAPTSRTPPAPIRRLLRQEVGFGCPLCGSPHLEYHHFDPPFAQKAHHTPEGMLALCATCHDEADAGAFSLEKLRALKTSKRTNVSSSFSWRRKHTVFSCAGTYAYKCNSMLQVHGIDIIYFEKDEDGFDTLSLNLYDCCMNKILEMRKNDWTCRTGVKDIETGPAKRKLQIRSPLHRISLNIEFKDRTILGKAELEICLAMGIPEQESVVFCYFTGNIAAPYPVNFLSDKILLPRGNIISGGQMVGCGVGIYVD